MEDQGVQSPQTFLVKNFSFLQLRHKHDDRCTFNTDRGYRIQIADLKQFPGLENKNGNVK